MPWIHTNDESACTLDEFTELMDKIQNLDENYANLEHVEEFMFVYPEDLFDHTVGEIMEMERQNEEDGLFLFESYLHGTA